MSIRAFLFDVGGVLLRTRDRASRERWERRLGLAVGKLDEIVFRNPIAFRATVGQATAEDVWQYVAAQFDLTSEDLSKLRVDFWSADRWDEDLLAFIDVLHAQYLTGVISDAWPGARAAVEAQVHAGRFDLILFSGEEGVQKPDPEIYRRALSRLGVSPAEAFFVDDRHKNVQGALDLGMHGTLFVNSEQLRGEIERLLYGTA
jgi:putative hydrolase of the HAD superfamily